MMRIAICLTAAAVALAASAHAAEGGKLEAKPAKVEPPKDLKDAVRDLLSDDAVQITDEKGGVAMTLWFRKEIPAKATPEQIKNGPTYREIQPTTIIGAVQLPGTWSDFRKQEIPAGVYTLRLAIQPQDGDHMGTAPYNEFCLLSPAGMDEKPEPMEVKALHKLSGNSTGGTHPAVMLLFPNPQPEDAPKTADKGNGIWVLAVKRPLTIGSDKAALGFAFTVAGHTSE
jgi:hypothetical protein